MQIPGSTGLTLPLLKHSAVNSLHENSHLSNHKEHERLQPQYAAALPLSSACGRGALQPIPSMEGKCQHTLSYRSAAGKRILKTEAQAKGESSFIPFLLLSIDLHDQIAASNFCTYLDRVCGNSSVFVTLDVL